MSQGSAKNTAVVVGAGIWGTSLACELARRRWAVTLLDRKPPGHSHAASSGRTRLVRCSHGSDRPYSELAWRSIECWQRLEQWARAPLLVRCGLAWLGHHANGFEAASSQTLHAMGVDAHLLEPSDAIRLFPSIYAEDLEVILYEPGAAVIRAAEAWSAMSRLAKLRGVDLRMADVAPCEDGVATVHADRIEADATVWATGGWLSQQFPADIRVTRQEYVYFDVGRAWSSVKIPAWIDYEESHYGHADLDGSGLKAAPDHLGPEFNLDAKRGSPKREVIDETRAYLERRFPGMALGGVRAGAVCQYAMTPDTRFLLRNHPARRDVYLLGGDSGHGFKHAPGLAEIVADWIVDGRAEVTELSTTGAVGPSLRTRFEDAGIPRAGPTGVDQPARTRLRQT